MKKIILSVLAVLSLNALSAQNSTPATNPPSGTGTNSNDRSNSGNMSTYPGRSNTPSSTQTQQYNQNVQVPGGVSKRYNTDYPNMQSSWSMNGKNYRADYMDTKTNKGRAVIYYPSGNPLMTERELGTGDYPRSINEYYNTNYPNEKYKVWSSEDNTGKRSYYVTRKSDVIWFDDKGTYRSLEQRSEMMNNNQHNPDMKNSNPDNH